MPSADAARFTDLIRQHRGLVPIAAEAAMSMRLARTGMIARDRAPGPCHLRRCRVPEDDASMHRNLFAVGTLAALIGAQQPATERPSPADALREKLASPFLHHADWTTDYAAALQLAAGEGKLVFGYFTTANY